VKSQQKIKKRSSFLLITFLFLTTFTTLKTFKKVNYNDISIFGSDLFSIEDIVSNSSLNFPTPLIFVKTKYIEKELKKNLSLENAAVYRQIFPFGLKIQIKTRAPIAYAQKISKGKKIVGFVDENGFFINKKYYEEENSKKLSIQVIGWDENFIDSLSKILQFQKNNDVEFVNIKFSQNGFLTLEEKSLKTIFLGLNSTIIETQLQVIYNLKNQLKNKIILGRIDNIDLIDPNNPKIKVFKP